MIYLNIVRGYKYYVHHKAAYFYFQYKIWLKPSAEQQFLYGHHVLKSGLGRITENTPKYQGVVILSMNDMPLVSECKTHSTVNDDVVFCILYYPCTSDVWLTVHCNSVWIRKTN